MAKHGSIGEFDGDRETWKSYTERLTQYFTANDVESADKQRAILLSVCDPTTYQLIRNILAPVQPTDRSFSELVELVERHRNPKPSVIVRRYNFNTGMKQPGESVADYTAKLRKIAEHCSFGNTLEDMLRDRIVCGISDPQLQRRLLAESELTYKTAFEIAQSWETAGTNTRDLQKSQASNSTVNRVVKPEQPTKKSQAVPGNPNNTTCNRCGGQHLASHCKYKQSKCHFCQKKGHLARVCLSKQHANPSSAGGRAQFKPPRQPGRTHLVDSTQQYTDEPDTYSLFTVTGHSNRPLLVTVEINGTTLDMEVDTGASRSLVSETTYNKLKTQTGLPPLQSTAAELRTYTGEQIPILGILEIPVCYHNQKVTVELLVVKGDGPSLMGKDWLQQITLDWHSLHHIRANHNSAVESLLAKHQDVFAEGLGKVKNFAAKLHVSPDAQPHYYRPRPVPHSIRAKLEKQLLELESLLLCNCSSSTIALNYYAIAHLPQLH